jgi:hypothetical protein
VNDAVEVSNSVREDADNGVFDGEKGEKGDKGDKGDPYVLTEEDKQDIVSKLSSEIPVREIEDRLDVHETTLNYLGTKLVSSWKDVQKVVQMGVAPIVFSVGDEFTCNHSIYGELTWKIIGFNSETLPNGETKPNMTIQLKSSTTSLGTEFDPKEALYAFGDTLPAGTYCFTLTEGYKDVVYNGKKHAVADYPYANFQFTTTEDAFKSDFSESGQLCFDSFTVSRSAVYMNLEAYSGSAPATNERTPIISVRSTKKNNDHYDGTDITD